MLGYASSNRTDTKITDFIQAPRDTWAINLMPSMPKIKSGHNGALLATGHKIIEQRYLRTFVRVC